MRLGALHRGLLGRRSRAVVGINVFATLLRVTLNSLFELELELILSQMVQKPLLRG